MRSWKRLRKLSRSRLGRQLLAGRNPAFGNFLAYMAGDARREMLDPSDLAEVRRHALVRLR
jgi:hypothetical protein